MNLKTVSLPTYILGIAFGAICQAQNTELDQVVIQSPILSLLNNETRVEKKVEQGALDLDLNLEAESIEIGTEGESYQLHAQPKVPGYTLRALESTKTIRLFIGGQRTEVQVPILIYMPDSDGVIASSSDITHSLGKEIIEVVSDYSSSIEPDAKNKLTNIAVSLDELSKGLDLETPKAEKASE